MANPYALAGESLSLHPDFPVVEGRYQLTEEWSFVLGRPHNRRLEDGSMVFWRPSFTVWVTAWGNNHGESVEARTAWIVSEASTEAFDVISGAKGQVYRHAYRLEESGPGGPRHAYYGYVVSDDGHLQLAVYFDDESDLGLAKSLVESVEHSSLD